MKTKLPFNSKLPWKKSVYPGHFEYKEFKIYCYNGYTIVALYCDQGHLKSTNTKDLVDKYIEKYYKNLHKDKTKEIKRLYFDIMKFYFDIGEKEKVPMDFLAE